MIAKRAKESKAWQGSYLGLARYILREGKAQTIETGWVSNCGFDDYTGAIKEIIATQDMNTRAAENDKTYHLVVSFPAGEKPDIETLKAIEQTLCQKIGLGNHQRISAVHDDTDHYHLHVAINKVHPKTHNLIEPYYDKKKLVAAAQELEISHGLLKQIDWNKDKDVHRENAPTNVNAKTMEHQSGTQSFQSWLLEKKQAIMEAIKPATNWQECHKALAHYDLTIRKHGNGLSISSRSHKAYIKASEFDRSTTLKKLEDKFGSYQEPDQAIKATAPTLQYQPSPKQQASNSQWEAFQQAMLDKKFELEWIKDEKKQAMDGLYKAYTERRAAIKDDRWLNRRSKQAAYQLLKQTYQAERKGLHQHYSQKMQGIFQQRPYRNWLDYLMHQTLQGDTEALKTLRSGKVSEKLTERFALWGEKEKDGMVLFTNLKPKTQKNGDILYNVGDIKIRDNGRLNTNDQTEEAIMLLLQLARQKYGNHLDVQGDHAFKQKVAECAAAAGMAVTFADPAIEQYRLTLEALKQQDKAKLNPEKPTDKPQRKDNNHER